MIKLHKNSAAENRAAGKIRIARMAALAWYAVE
jgi:hypothetical protein